MLFVLNRCFVFVHHMVFVSASPPPVVRMKLMKKKCREWVTVTSATHLESTQPDDE